MVSRSHRTFLLAVMSVVVTGATVAARLEEASPAQTRAARAEHAIAGEVKKVDDAAKTIVIHTADGIDETVKFTDRTAVRGLKGVTRAADATAKAGLEGGAVVLHYTEEGVAKTAVSVDHLGKRALKMVKGTVERVDQGGKFVVVKTAAGAEETFALTKDVVVDTGRGIEAAGDVAGKSIEKGAEVTVHYSEDAGKRILHLLKHL